MRPNESNNALVTVMFSIKLEARHVRLRSSLENPISLRAATRVDINLSGVLLNVSGEGELHT